MSLCEENCDLVEYNYTTEKAKCSCSVKINIPSLDDIKFDKNKLYKNFIDINNIANLNILKCYKIVFNKEALKKNYGFFIFIFIFALFFICLFLFRYKYYFSLIYEIYKIQKAFNEIFKEDDEKLEKFNLEKETIDTKNKTIKIENEQYKLNTNNNINNKEKSKVNENKEIVNQSFPPKKTKKKKKKKKRKKRNQNSILASSNKVAVESNNINIFVNNNTALNKENNKDIINKEIMKYNEREFNSLSYEKAIEEDKRTYNQYYFSLLKMNHLFVFTFYSNNNDYNSQIIKIFLFFFLFYVHLTVNALFFNDDTMHKIYVDEGQYNFIYQLPQIIYSTIISTFINMLIKFLALTEKMILEIKNMKKSEDLDLKVKKTIKTIKIKFILFFIITFILLLLFMYYISCFCGIYENTQIHLIKDSVLSFSLSLIYPLLIYLLPGWFRITALRAPKGNRGLLYKISKLFHFI